MAKIKPLKKSPFVKDLNNKEVALLSGAVDERELAPGEEAAEESATGEGLFIVATGSLVVRTRLPDGSAAEVMTLEPGQSFGELSLVGEGPRQVTVNAGPEGARVLVITRPAFEKLVGTDPGVAAKFLQGILREVGAATRAGAAQIKKLIAAAKG